MAPIDPTWNFLELTIACLLASAVLLLTVATTRLALSSKGSLLKRLYWGACGFVLWAGIVRLVCHPVTV